MKDIKFKHEFGSGRDCKFRKSRTREGVLVEWNSLVNKYLLIDYISMVGCMYIDMNKK